MYGFKIRLVSFNCLTRNVIFALLRSFELWNMAVIVYEWTYASQVSHKVRSGDKVSCTISELQPLKAQPEDIPLNIVYEDDHVLVVNKPAHMVWFLIFCCCYETTVVCIWTPETFICKSHAPPHLILSKYAHKKVML